MGRSEEAGPPATAMLSLTALINRLIKPMPIRKELRMLKINLVIEEFYNASEDVEQRGSEPRSFCAAA